MLKTGEMVLYGAAGACRVKEICTKKFGDGQEREYYVLTPLHDGRTTLYVPVDNQALHAKMRKLLSAGELEELLLSVPREEEIWISDEKVRQETYRNTIKKADRRELIGMTKTLYNRRKQMMAAGRKLHVADERLYREAEKLLCDEFVVVLGLEASQVMPFILGRLEERKEM
ncbi:MAG: CarD family transcriptional regulator [Lachnospiraceae bacterium]|nr:CarD family transcriptional regulator [Lachnospiraceae bacterium]